MSGQPVESLAKKLESDPRFARTLDLLRRFEALVDEAVEPQVERESIDDALSLMFELHLDQKDRPDGQPYVNHTLGVALGVIEEFGVRDPRVINAALLHDAVEDQAGKLAGLSPSGDHGESGLHEAASLALQGRFGERTAQIVRALTNPDFQAMIATRRQEGDETPEDDLYVHLYCEHSREILQTDPEAFVVKLADFSDNALRIGHLEEGPKKTWLRRKYGPVIQMVLRELSDLDGSKHLLATRKQDVMNRLSAAYA